MLYTVTVFKATECILSFRVTSQGDFSGGIFLTDGFQVPLGGFRGVILRRAFKYFGGDLSGYFKERLQGTFKEGQGVVLVTEPHAELNAGFVGLFASGHPAIFNWAQWNVETKNLNERDFEERCSQTAGLLTSAYWTLVSQYLCRRLLSHELSPDASKAWIQTGLALSPLFGTVAQHSIDVIIAWAVIGEWSSRVLFPPPDGQWPRHGHPQCIGELYVQRAPSLTAWARACFEQGALASLLFHTNVQRPVILHAYGGSNPTTAPADSERRLIALIAVAKALPCSKGMCTWHLAQGY